MENDPSEQGCVLIIKPEQHGVEIWIIYDDMNMGPPNSFIYNPSVNIGKTDTDSTERRKVACHF